MSPEARQFPSGLNRTAFTEVVCLNAWTNVTSRTCSIVLLYMAYQVGCGVCGSFHRINGGWRGFDYFRTWRKDLVWPFGDGKGEALVVEYGEIIGAVRWVPTSCDSTNATVGIWEVDSRCFAKFAGNILPLQLWQTILRIVSNSPYRFVTTWR